MKIAVNRLELLGDAKKALAIGKPPSFSEEQK